MHACMHPPALQFFAIKTNQDGTDDARVLYEWCLSEAIAACMRCGSGSPSNRKGKDAEDTSGGDEQEDEGKNSDNVAQTPTEVLSVVKTGIAAWDAAISDEAKSIAKKDRAEAVAAARKEKVHKPTAAANAGVVLYGDSVVERKSVEKTDNASPGQGITAAFRTDEHDQTRKRGSPTGDCKSPTEERKGENEGSVRGDSEDEMSAQGVKETTEDRNDLPRERKQPNTGKDAAGSLSVGQSRVSMRRPLSPHRRSGSSGFEKALRLATQCVSVDAFNSNAYALRGELQARLGRRDRAIADYEAAALLERADPRPRINQVCVLGARLESCEYKMKPRLKLRVKCVHALRFH